MHPDRIVVGTDDERARKVHRGDLSAALSQSGADHVHRRRTAELIKYAANAFLATKITFINEIADLCERSAPTSRTSRAASASTTASAANSCMPAGFRRLLLSQGHARAGQDGAGRRRAAAHRRDRGRGQRCAQARDGAQGRGRARRHLRGKTIGVLGLTFKPNTDDMRDAPSIPLITALQDLGATVRAYDPVGMEQAKRELPDVIFATAPMAARRGADALVIVTEWEHSAPSICPAEAGCAASDRRPAQYLSPRGDGRTRLHL